MHKSHHHRNTLNTHHPQTACPPSVRVVCVQFGLCVRWSWSCERFWVWNSSRRKTQNKQHVLEQCGRRPGSNSAGQAVSHQQCEYVCCRVVLTSAASSTRRPTASTRPSGPRPPNSQEPTKGTPLNRHICDLCHINRHSRFDTGTAWGTNATAVAAAAAACDFNEISS